MLCYYGLIIQVWSHLTNSTTGGSRLIFSIPFSYFLFIFYLPVASYRIFLLFHPWLPCHFYLVVIEQQLRYLLPRIERPRTTFEHLNFATFERSLQSSHVYCPTKFGISKHFRRNYQIVFTRCTQHIKLINHSMNFDE